MWLRGKTVWKLRETLPAWKKLISALRIDKRKLSVVRTFGKAWHILRTSNRSSCLVAFLDEARSKKALVTPQWSQHRTWETSKGTYWATCDKNIVCLEIAEFFRSYIYFPNISIIQDAFNVHTILYHNHNENNKNNNSYTFKDLISDGLPGRKNF